LIEEEYKIEHRSNMTQEAETKSISISGNAAQDYLGGGKKRATRSTQKKVKGGGEEPLHGVSTNAMNVKGIETQPTIATTAGSPDPAKWLHTPAMVPPRIVPHPSVVPATPAQSAAPTNQYMTGGVKNIKVELQKKAVTKKVQLHPKKAEVVKHSSQKKHHTRRVRKITLGVSSLHKRMTRAKKMHKKVKEMPLEELKKHLIAKKLIKPTSKAPESVLRQIAADAQIVAGKAL
jgi:hypothetical protein